MKILKALYTAFGASFHLVTAGLLAVFTYMYLTGGLKVLHVTEHMWVVTIH